MIMIIVVSGIYEEDVTSNPVPVQRSRDRVVLAVAAGRNHAHYLRDDSCNRRVIVV